MIIQLDNLNLKENLKKATAMYVYKHICTRGKMSFERIIYIIYIYILQYIVLNYVTIM